MGPILRGGGASGSSKRQVCVNFQTDRPKKQTNKTKILSRLPKLYETLSMLYRPSYSL